MKKFILFFLFVSSAFATEVATIEKSKSNPEFTLILTDDALQAPLEKHFMTRSCKPRSNMNNQVSSVREHMFLKPCRAEVIQFLLNNGYKADPLFQTFTK
jgi:hypothetical protein